MPLQYSIKGAVVLATS